MTKAKLTVISLLLFTSILGITPILAGGWVQHPLETSNWGVHDVGRYGVGLAKTTSDQLLFFNALTSVWTEHELETPMSVVAVLADGYLVLVVGQDRAVVFNTLTSSVSPLDFQGDLLSTSLPTRSFDCRSELAMVVTDQEFCVFDAEVDQWHRRPYTLPAPAAYTVRHECHDMYAVSFIPLTNNQRVNLVYSLIQHDSNESAQGLNYLATPMDYGYAGQATTDTHRYYFGYSAVTNTFDSVDWPLSVSSEGVSINTSESIGLKTAYASGYYEDYDDDIRHYHAYGFDTRQGQWQHDLHIVDRTEFSLSAWRAGGTYCGVSLWNVGVSYDLLVFDGTANSWHVENLDLDSAGSTFMYAGNIVLGQDSSGMVGVDLASASRSTCGNLYDSRYCGGQNYADYLSDGPGEDMVTINCYNGNANTWQSHLTGYHSSAGWASPHVHLRISGDPQREAIFYSAYRNEIYAKSLGGWPTASPLITDNFTGVVNDSEGLAVLYDAHRGTVYELSGFDRHSQGSRYFMTLDNSSHEAQAYSAATGTWGSTILEADGVVYGGSDLIGIAMCATASVYNRFYAYDARDNSWALLEASATGGAYRVGEGTAYVFNSYNAYALGTGGITAVPMAFFTLQGNHGAVEARWECAAELTEGEVRVTAAGPEGETSASWSVPATREAAGYFRALDNHPNLAKGGQFTYLLETAGDDGQWNVAAKEKINLRPLPRIAIRGVHPNPFNPRTAITFYLADPQQVMLYVYDVAGRRVRILGNEPLAQGQHTVHWDGCDDAGRSMASGVYTVRIESGSGGDRRKMLLVR